MISLFGQTGVSASPGESIFTEGFALNAGVLARQFNTVSQSGVAGRVACTTAGFNAFPATDITGCRAAFTQTYSFAGVYLVRPTAAVIPEPWTLGLVGIGLAGIGLARRREG